jgi:hypothetical protein
MWKLPGSVCPGIERLVGFSRNLIQQLLTQVLSLHVLREKRVSGADTLLIGGNKFISVRSIYLTDVGEIRYYMLRI